ncbi:hypothetical protein MSAN_02377900 [Mycena sanguinolenta]|uniref:Uncharacterized protein n=1 Tax=Mycena sanguinolenta TaxID=230812 RepID=A0A8H7CFB5_9AGAR|nr:hypothetical protein MSAN_02377900 [Mycena sanguinolenta]
MRLMERSRDDAQAVQLRPGRAVPTLSDFPTPCKRAPRRRNAAPHAIPVQATAPAPAALADEKVNPSPASSLNNPANSSLASSASLTATSPNPNSTPANPPQRESVKSPASSISITMMISPPIALLWTDCEPWNDADNDNLSTNAMHGEEQGERITENWVLTLGPRRQTRANEPFDVTKRVHRVHAATSRISVAIEGIPILINDIRRFLPGPERAASQLASGLGGRVEGPQRHASVHGGVYPAWCSPMSPCARHVHRVQTRRDRRGQAIERILIKDIYLLLPEVGTSQHCRGSVIASRLMRQAAQAPPRCRSSDSKLQSMAKSGNSADAAVVSQLASRSCWGGSTFDASVMQGDGDDARRAVG